MSFTYFIKKIDPFQNGGSDIMFSYRFGFEFLQRSFIVFRIGEVIDEDVLHARVPFVARTQQCFAVKAGIDGLLDIARRSFCDTSEGSLFSTYIPLCRFLF